MANLTHAEAIRRATLLQVSAYQIDLDLTGGGDTFGSTTVIQFTSAEPGAPTFLDLRPAQLHQVILNGGHLDPQSVRDGRLEIVPAAHNELVVRATMRYTNEGQGLHRFIDPADGLTYLYAQTFLDEAPSVFACFDQPDLKAPVTMSVRAPADWVVAANSAGTYDGDGQWTFATTKPIATYFTTVIAGPYHLVTAEHDGIALGLYARASQAAQLDQQSPELFQLTGACLDRFHQLFGVRYPFGKYDQAFVPEFNAGAMENPGLVTIRDDFLFRSAVTDAQLEERAAVIAHEMAHMWFGDLVTMRWWDDLWLNESFAEYMGYRVVAEATRFRDAWTTFALGRKSWGYAADQRPSTHPVAADVADAGSALINFDGISYAKGAAVLRQLVAWLGDEAFLAGLRDHFHAHAYANASLADLLVSLGQASGRDLSRWAELWLRTPGVNTLRRRDGQITQEGAVLRPHRIGVAAYQELDGRVTARERVDVDLDPATADGSRTLPFAPAGLILLNDGDLTYAKVRLTDAELADLEHVLPRIDDGLARALLWSAVWHAVRDGEVPAQDLVRLAETVLPGEPQIGLVADVLGWVWQAVDQYLDPGLRQAALDRLQTACLGVLTPLIRPTDPASTRAPAAAGRQLTFLRGAVRFTTAGSAPLIRSWLDLDVTPTGVPVDTEVRWDIWYRLSGLGLASPQEIDEAYERDRSAAGAEHAARCRAARPDPQAKATAWDSIVNDRSESSRLIMATAAAFWQAGQDYVAAEYVDRYARDVATMARGRNSWVTWELARFAFPRFAASSEAFARLHDLFAADHLPLPVRRAVTDGMDDLRRSIAARTCSGTWRDSLPAVSETAASAGRAAE